MFNSIPSALIAVGKPIIKLLWDYTKDNFDDHESRIAGVEQGATKIEVWNDLVRVRLNSSSLTGFDIYRAVANMQLIEARIAIFAKGGVSSGILEFDIKKSNNLDFTAAPSIFTTRPSLDLSLANDYDQSINAVFDINEQTLTKDDRLRLDITSLPSGLSKFEIYLLGELN